MAKITLEASDTDTIIGVSGPSSFLPLNKAVGNNGNVFKIVLDTATASADLSKIGTAADNTTLVFFGKSTEYHQSLTTKKGFVQIFANSDTLNKTPIATLTIDKATNTILAHTTTNIQFTDYAPGTFVHWNLKVTGTGSAKVTTLVSDHLPDLAPTVTLSSSAAAVNEGSAVTYTATLNKVSATDLNITYTLGGTATLTADYTGSVATTGNIKIVAGALTGTLVLTAVNDAKTEGAETVSVALGAAAAVTTTINDTSLTPIVPTVAVARAIAVKATDANTVATAVDANGAVADLNDNVAFNISAGTFGYAIKNFAAGDKLNFFANAIVNVLPDANNTDGIQVLTAQDAATGTTTTVTLTGLTADQDLGVFNFPSFATIFGAGSMTVDGLFTAATTPAVAPVKATPVTVSATTATAPFVATANSDTFTIASGTYAATIDKFAATDVLKFFTGAIINVLPDIDNADGKQVLTAQDSTTGTTATITLTGLTAAQDAGLFNQPSFATVFGAGTIA
ncbi:MAG: hypothetical protein NTZ70_04630 [Methylococcales bacterium]|nr:hypothetical protein [Methylococcales bacterium]